MLAVNILEAKTQFSNLIARAMKGEDIIIARAGTPVARLTALVSKKTAQSRGSLKHHIHLHEDFDAPLPDDITCAFGQK